MNMQIIVCGNERLAKETLGVSVTSLVLELNDAYEIAKTTYEAWFSVSNLDHAKCSQTSYELRQGAYCEQSLDS